MTSIKTQTIETPIKLPFSTLETNFTQSWILKHTWNICQNPNLTTTQLNLNQRLGLTRLLLFTPRGGNNGGSWDPSSQKTFGLTENFQWNCRFFVVKINFWGKLQLFHWENEIFAKDITIFKHSNSNLMIISDVNTALSQKILGPDS